MDTTKQTDTAAETVDPRHPDTPIGIVRSRDAFLRDLPMLLANPQYHGRYAAYHGDERIGIAESHLDLLDECERRGLNRDQCIVARISPQWFEEEEIEHGLYEFDDIEIDEGDGGVPGPSGIS